jgi:hypothetical protein
MLLQSVMAVISAENESYWKTEKGKKENASNREC